MATNSKVRLAGHGTPGAEMYNYYQLISLLSSLYVKGIDRGDSEMFAGLWDACSVTILEQIGIAHDCWEKLQTQLSSGIPRPEDEALVDRTLSLVSRMLVLDQQLNEWTMLSRWARVLLLVEAQICKVGERVAKHEPFLAESIHAMSGVIQSRISLLRQLQKQSLSDETALTENFAEPVALV